MLPLLQIVPTGLEFGREGLARYRDFRFNPAIKHARRFYPHAHNLDGEYPAGVCTVCTAVVPACSTLVKECGGCDAGGGGGCGGDAGSGNAGVLIVCVQLHILLSTIINWATEAVVASCFHTYHLLHCLCC